MLKRFIKNLFRYFKMKQRFDSEWERFVAFENNDNAVKYMFVWDDYFCIVTEEYNCFKFRVKDLALMKKLSRIKEIDKPALRYKDLSKVGLKKTA